jgi:hypothetical protein
MGFRLIRVHLCQFVVWKAVQSFVSEFGFIGLAMT